MQVVCDPPLFARATLDHLAVNTRTLCEFTLQKRVPSLPDFFKSVALLAGQDFCLFSVGNIKGNCYEPLRFPAVILLQPPMRVDPAHVAICANNPKLDVVIFAVLNCLIHCPSNSVAIFCVRSGNQLFECDPSEARQTELSTARARHPDFISFKIPFPHNVRSPQVLRSSPAFALSAPDRSTAGRERQTRSGIHRPEDGDPIHGNVAAAGSTPITSDFPSRSFRKNDEHFRIYRSSRTS